MPAYKPHSVRQEDIHNVNSSRPKALLPIELPGIMPYEVQAFLRAAKAGSLPKQRRVHPVHKKASRSGG